MTTVLQMTYQPAQRGAGAVETLTFGRLRELNDGGTQRADFHVLAVVDAGHGLVTVDFAVHPFGGRTVVWVPPGAVHRWDDIADVEGHLVLFVSTAPVTRATRDFVASPDRATQWSVPDADWPFVDAGRNHLLLETSHVPVDSSNELPGLLLSVLIARLRPPQGEAPAMNPTFRLFRSSVEANFREHHDVAYYARTLGYAPRTLTRAVQQATGQTAKSFIVERIVLEAKRLLAHDRLTAASCAVRLGFPDASNFSVFFKQATGMRPGAWQAMAAGTPTPSRP